jgi:hypothetical protein
LNPSLGSFDAKGDAVNLRVGSIISCVALGFVSVIDWAFDDR